MKRFLSVSSVIFLYGCSSLGVSYKLEPHAGQTTEWTQGVPQVLVSTPGGSGLILKPTNTDLKVGDELLFEIVVANFNNSDLLIDAPQATIEYTQSGSTITVQAKSFSEWEQYKKSQGGTSSSTWMAMVASLATTAIDVDAGLGQSYESQEMAQQMMMLGEADTEKNNSIRNEIDDTRALYLQKTTLRPDDRHKGLIYFGKLQDHDGSLTISIEIGSDLHKVHFDLI